MKTNFSSHLESQGRWMIVDDDEDILAIMRELCAALGGVDVECFNSPRAALDAFEDQPGAFAIIITDFHMPEMNGVELCHALHKISRAQKIFLMTGSAFFTDVQAARAGFSGRLQKPFLPGELQALFADEDICQNKMAFA